MRDKIIIAVVVTYNPDVSLFVNRVKSISSQVFKVIIIDNSLKSSWFDAGEFDDNVSLFPLNENRGIAHAQNVGILESYKFGADFVVTFDQDSKIEKSFINDLLSEYERACEKVGENNIACIGPSVINERDGAIYTKYFDNSTMVMENIHAVRSLISSGTIIPMASFINVGLMCSPWFIDSIDIEWCYKARYYGFYVLMTKNVTITHNLGSSDQSLLFGKKITLGAPIRLYYVFRNWIFSLSLPYFPLRYKFKVLIFMPIKILIFSLMKPRRERIKYMLAGLKDGFQKRFGIFK